MKFHATVLAGLSLIGGMCLMTTIPASAATSAAASPGSSTNAPVPSSAMPSRNTMYKGSMESPHDVAVLQEALDSTGANLKVDGAWGPKTEAALRNYQRIHGLQVTGQLNKATFTKLEPIG